MSSDANRPTTLLICDDHKILTDALAMVVERDGSLRMIPPPFTCPRRPSNCAVSISPMSC